MAKLIEYDVTDVEESSGGTGVKVKPGVRVAEIMRCQHRTEKRNGDPANDLEIALSFGDEFDWVFTYVGLDKASDWKLAELIRALALKDKGKIDPDKLKGKIIRVKVNSGEYQGEYRPEAGRLMPAQKGDTVGGSVSEMAAAADDAGDDPDAGDGDAGATQYPDGFEPTREDPDDPDVGSYDDWTDEDISGEVEDRGLTLPGGRGGKRDKGIAALRADDAAADEGDGEPEPDGDGDDYDTWELDALTQEYNDRGFDDPVPAFKGRNAAARIKAAIIEALREDDNSSPFEG